MSLYDLIRKVIRLYDVNGSLSVVLRFLVGFATMVLEAVGALMVFGLIAAVADPGRTLALPAVGDLRSLAGGEHPGFLLSLTASAGVFFLLRAGAQLTNSYLQNRIVQEAAASLSNRLVAGYLALPYPFHLQRNSSQLIRNAYVTPQQVAVQALLPLLRCGGEVILVLGLTALLVKVSLPATLLALAVQGCATLFLLYMVQPRLQGLGEIAHHLAASTVRSLQQGFQGVRDIKLLGCETEFAGEFARDRHILARSRTLESFSWDLPRTVVETALIAFMLALFAGAVVLRGQARDVLQSLDSSRMQACAFSPHSRSSLQA